VLLNTEATAQKVLESKPDFVFLALGARPRVPDVPGINGPGVALATDVLKGKARLGKEVVVVGGGWWAASLLSTWPRKARRSP